MSEVAKLKPGIVFAEISSAMGSYVMVKDSARLRYFKFEPWEKTLLELFDGTRTAEGIAEASRRVMPERRIDEQFVLDFAEMLRELDLVERPVRERFLMLAEKTRARRKRRLWDAETSTPTMIRIPMFDPDRAMDRIVPWIRWVWSPAFVLVAAAVIAGTLGFLVAHWDLYWAGLLQMLDPQEGGIAGVAYLFVLITVVSLWHELGHGFSCKRFGGEVHDIGFMLFYFQPAFYCAVDDSYLFTNRWHRIAVALGGLYFETLLCAAALGVWLTTPAESAVHRVALGTVFLCGIVSVLINANPLIKLDGYYVVMDYLDVPNLREESFAYVGALFRRILLGSDEPLPSHPTRRKRIFVAYGVLATLYTTFLYTTLFLLLARWFERAIGPTGPLAAAALVLWMLRKRIAKLGRSGAAAWRAAGQRGSTPRSLLLGGLAVAAVLLALVPTRTRLDAEFAVEAGRRAVFRAPAGAFVTAVEVSEGQKVAEGAPLAVLESPDLAATRESAASEASAASRESLAARAAGDPARYLERAAAASGAASVRDGVAARLDRLAFKAPFAGTVSTPYLESLPGRFVHEGETVLSLDDLSTVKLAASVLESDVQEIVPGTEVRLRAVSAPFETLRATVKSVSAKAVEPDASPAARVDLVRRAQRVRVLVEVANPRGRLRPGMSGEVQFLTKPRSVFGKAAWRVGRWLGRIVW